MTKRTDSLAAGLIFLVFTILYFVTRTRCHVYADDSLWFVIRVETGVEAHNHHILYQFFSNIFFQAGRLLGLTDRPLVPMQALSAVASAAGLSTVFLLFRRLGSSLAASLGTTLILAFTYGFWAYSIAPDVYILETSALILGVYVLFRAVDRPVRVADGLLLSLALVLSVVNHQAAILFYPVAVFGLALSPAPLGRRARVAVLFSLLSAAVIIGIYIGTYFSLGRPDPSFADFWLFMMQMVEEMPTLPGDKGIVLSSFARAAAGFSQAVASGNFLFAIDSVYDAAQNRFPYKYLLDDRYLVRNLGTVSLGIIMASTLVFLGTVVAMKLTRIRRVRPLFRDRKFLIVLVWFALFGVFNLWWEPGSNEFWIVTLAPLVIGFHLWIFGDGRDDRRMTRLAFVAAAALFLVNGLGAVFPMMDGSNDYWMANKTYFDRVTSRDAVVIYEAQSGAASARYNTGATLVNLLSGPGKPYDGEKALRELDAVVAAGGTVFLDPRAMQPDFMTLRLDRYFAPEQAALYPGHLREIVERYREHAEFPPLTAPAPNDPPPTLEVTP